ncbi:Veg family protein [Streptococcus caprae]|uniref:Veg family protein n=1 Tax=Streptococcus caprae TaxID=1640501 RepID=A0ABV8CV04_9STRE
MSDAFADVAKMKKIKEEIKAHEGQEVELTLENGRKREKNKIGRLTEVYPSLFIVEYSDQSSEAGAISNTYVESYTYSDILTEKTLIRYFD